MTLRKVIKTRASFPSEEAALKLLYLALTNVSKKWKAATTWRTALNQFTLLWAYAPKPGAPARPVIVRKACQQLAGGRRTLEKCYLHKIGNTTEQNGASPRPYQGFRQ